MSHKFLIAALLLLGITTHVWGYGAGDRIETTAEVSVYQGASIKSKSLGKLDPHSELIVTKNSNNNGWVHVKPAAGVKLKFKSGWIQAANTLKKTVAPAKAGNAKNKNKGQKAIAAKSDKGKGANKNAKGPAKPVKNTPPSTEASEALPDSQDTTQPVEGTAQ